MAAITELKDSVTRDVRVTIAVRIDGANTRSLEVTQVAGESDDDFLQRIAIVLDVLKRRTMSRGVIDPSDR